MELELELAFFTSSSFDHSSNDRGDFCNRKNDVPSNLLDFIKMSQPRITKLNKFMIVRTGVTNLASCEPDQ